MALFEIIQAAEVFVSAEMVYNFDFFLPSLSIPPPITIVATTS
jgi:hypothetical protein